MKKISFLFLLILPVACFSQVKSIKLSQKDIPASIKYNGSIVDAYRFSDISGEYIVVTSEFVQDRKMDTTSENIRGELYAYCYTLKPDSVKLVWKLHDLEKECPFDLYVNFIKNSFAITDLDKDNKAEIWMMYRVCCRSDVSPCTMKIIMYEGYQKYALRGNSKLKLTETASEGGEFTLDDAFKKGPGVFSNYAKQLWQKSNIDTWSD